eukprot:6903987-Pyramimonas_sp.AAC.1
MGMIVTLAEVVKVAPPKYRSWTIQRFRIEKRVASEILDRWIVDSRYLGAPLSLIYYFIKY